SGVMWLFLIAQSQPPVFPRRVDALRSGLPDYLSHDFGLPALRYERNDNRAAMPKRILIDKQVIFWQSFDQALIQRFPENRTTQRAAQTEKRCRQKTDRND